MPQTPLTAPEIDPTPIFELFRGSYGTELLTAAVTHLNLFGVLADGPLAFDALRERLGLQRRPAIVLITALRAMNLLREDSQGRIRLTELSREHLTPGRLWTSAATSVWRPEVPGWSRWSSVCGRIGPPARTRKVPEPRSSSGKGSNRPWNGRPRRGP